MSRLNSCWLLAVPLLIACLSSGRGLRADDETDTQTQKTSAPTAVGVVKGHNVLANRARSINDSELARLTFQDLDGKVYHLEQIVEKGPAVFLFTSTVCPVAQRYTARLKRLHAEFQPQGVSLFAVSSNEEDTRESLAEYARKTDFPFPVVRDVSGYLADRLGATATPQVFLVDTTGHIAYRGGIDDHRIETRVKSHYLKDALQAVLAGEPVKVTQTDALGCTIHRETDVENIESVTYSSHIARILQDNCQSCHRPGQVAPFPLTSYEEAKRWATEIKEYTHSRVMPPWKAARGYGEFKDDASLADDELELIARWVNAGTPQGDERDIPPNPVFADKWQLGDPDHEIVMPEVYTIEPEGEDDYRHFIVPTNFEEDLYVQMIDVLPGNLKCVHHVIAYVDNSEDRIARRLDDEDPGPGYTRFGGPGFKPASVLGGWAPGKKPVRNPDGCGSILPKGADIVLQVHYYKTGFEETDLTRIGLYLTKDESPIELRRGAALPWYKRDDGEIIRNEFTIPPDNPRYRIDASSPVGEPMWLLSVTPHMHVLGREMKVFAEHPDWPEPKPLVWIKDWDFNWQLGYILKEPMYLPKGAIIRAEAWYDNSAGNPNNPSSPTQPVSFGEKTTDEMCFAFYSYLKASEYTPPGKK